MISALDKISGEKYAIKKIAKTFDNNEDAKRILREIILMTRFNHENIIKMVCRHMNLVKFSVMLYVLISLLIILYNALLCMCHSFDIGRPDTTA